MAGVEEKPRTVLIAMDGSDFSINAFKWYAENVYKETDNVIMLYSVELANHYNAPVWYNAPEAWDREILEKIIKDEISKISERLEGYADIMRKAKVKGTARCVQASSPGEGIIDASKQLHADFIITGSRGLGKIHTWWVLQAIQELLTLPEHPATLLFGNSRVHFTLQYTCPMHV